MKKHNIYIEGRDNVGKTTTINELKENCQEYDNVTFLKYPLSNNINLINSMSSKIYELNRYINVCINMNEEINELTMKLMKLMLSEMNDVFYINNKEIINSIKHNICDRGFLSTYLYQYRAYNRLYKVLNLSMYNEKALLQEFIDEYIPIYDDIYHTIIILNDNKYPVTNVLDKEETIQYKKIYDQDINLQIRVSNSIDNIVLMVNNIYPYIKQKNISIHPIDIYDVNGDRKEPKVICKEIKNIINKIELEES